MDFESRRPDVVRSVRQRWLLNYWERLRKSRPVPLWKDLAAEEIGGMADGMQFCDIATDGTAMRFVIRFRGARITEAYGDCDGKFLDETLPPLLREATLSTYRRAAESMRPVYTVCNTPDSTGRPVDFERLLLPFGDEGGRVHRILSMLEWVSIEGRFESRDLLKSQAAAPVYSLCSIIDHIETGAFTA